MVARAMSSQLTECRHNVVYAGVINLIRGFGVIGTIDAWTCTLCNEIWCDERRLGVQEIPSEVGLPKRIDGTEWAVIFCDDGVKTDWNLVQVKKRQELDHSCAVSSGCNIKVEDYWSLTCTTEQHITHRLILVRNSLNKNVYV